MVAKIEHGKSPATEDKKKRDNEINYYYSKEADIDASELCYKITRIQ
jgi:hypothetical protein